LVQRVGFGQRGSIPGWGKSSSILQTVQTEPGTHSDLYSMKKLITTCDSLCQWHGRNIGHTHCYK